MEKLIGRTIALALLALGYFTIRWVRSRSARRRRQVFPGLAGTRVPLRLRGIAVAYPGFWRAGWLDLSTGVWRPRGRWGLPVSLGGARIQSVRSAHKTDGLPPFAHDDVVLTGADMSGQMFQLAAVNRDDAGVVADYLVESVGPAPEVGRLVWLRNRVPMIGVVLVLSAMAVAGYEGLSLLGVQQVDAVVVDNAGSSYLCKVAWSDPAHGTGGSGWADCGDLTPGEHLLVSAMGWPRSGQVDDVENVVVGVWVMAGSGTMLAAIFVGGPAWQRRKLARAPA
jgi:hypothetical protein